MQIVQHHPVGEKLYFVDKADGYKVRKAEVSGVEIHQGVNEDPHQPTILYNLKAKSLTFLGVDSTDVFETKSQAMKRRKEYQNVDGTEQPTEV